MKKKILIILITVLSATGSIAQSDYIFPAEFEKNEGVLLTWDYHPDRNPVTAAIAKAVQNLQHFIHRFLTKIVFSS